MSSVYEHRYEPVSIYGNVVSLLRECGGRSGVHLDFGCGYGAIAEPIRDELGLAYLGFDIASDGLDSLRRRGFEAHRIDLYDLDQAETLAERAIGNRPIASMTCLDTLEHITNGEEVLKLLRRIAELADAPLVLSVPNVTHKDLALKLLIGRWDVTEAGLLDHTHVTLYSHARLSRLMMAVGWRQTAARDWLLQHSDQEFPASTAVLNHRLPIGHFLLDFINRANPHAIVNQFVRLYRVAAPQPQPLLETRDEAAAPGPFLSVITRTLGTRIHTLRDTLMSLAGQTCQDFELILVVHSTKETVLDTVRTLVAEFPSSFRQRVSVISCDRPGRSSPLNDGIRHAKGTYIVALDDDDIALGHWVESYRRLASESPGTLLRTTCTRQEFALGTADDVLPRWRAVSWFEMKWPAAYDAVAHLHTNYTPNMSVAFPAALFWEDGLCFDETMETAEDWDFMTRAAMLRGVASSPEVTSIYRWWINGESTLLTRTREQWEANARRIREKWNSRPLLLPRGSASRITSLIEEGSALRAQLGDLQFQHRHLEFQHRHLGQHARNLEQHIDNLESRIRYLDGEIHNHERHRLGLERFSRALEKHVHNIEESNNKLEEYRRELERRNQYMAVELVRAGCWLPWADEDPRLIEISREVLSGLLASTSWRSTRLFRRMVAFCSGRRGDDLTDDAIPSSFAERQRLIREIPRSTSWRIAFPVRIVGRMLQRSRTIAPQ